MRRRLSYADYRDRPRDRRAAGFGPARQHADHLRDGRQRRQRRRHAARHDQRSGYRRQRRHRIASLPDVDVRRTGRPPFLRPLSRRLGARDGRADAMDQAGRLAFRRDAQRHGHLMAEAHQRSRALSARSSARSSISSRPSTKRPVSRRRNAWMGSHRNRSRASSLVYTWDKANAQRAVAPHDAVLRAGRQPRHLQGRLDGEHHAAPPAVGYFGCGLPARTTSSGSSTTSTRIRRKRPIWRPRIPRSSKNCKTPFDVEAAKYQVLPLDSSFAERANPAIRPSLTRGRTQFTYYPGMIRIPEGSAPDFKNKSFTIGARVSFPKGGAEGVLATMGGNFAGWSLFVMNGKPEFAYAYSNQPQHKYRDRFAREAHPREPRDPRVVQVRRRRGRQRRHPDAVRRSEASRARPGRSHRDQPVLAGRNLRHRRRYGNARGPRLRSEDAVRFTGTLKKLTVLLQPEKLTEEQKEQLLRDEAPRHGGRRLRKERTERETSRSFLRRVRRARPEPLLLRRPVPPGPTPRRTGPTRAMPGPPLGRP